MAEGTDCTGGDGRGRYTKTLETADRDRHAAELHSTGLPYVDIATAIGYCNAGATYKAVMHALDARVRPAAEEVREQEILKLDALERAVWSVLRRNHLTIQQGRIVQLMGGRCRMTPRILVAADRLVKIAERRARLLGLDADPQVHRDLRERG